MKREKKLLINTIILGFGSILPKSASFLILPILTAALSKAEYGTYDLVLTSTSLVLPVFSLLIEQGVFRFLLDTKTENDRKKVITNSTIYVMITSLVLFLLSVLILNQFKIEFKILISLYLVLNLHYKFVIQVCRGLGDLKKYSLASIINSFFNLLLIYFLVGNIKLGLYGLLVALVISVFLATIYAIISSGIIRYISFKLCSSQYIKELLKYSAPLLPNSLSWWVIGASDRWIISAFLSVEMTAVYAIANKIPSMFNLFYNNFNLAWQESATITSKDSDAKTYYTNIFNHLFNFLVGLLLVLMTISPVLFGIFIDKQYYLAYYQMPILFFAMFFHSLSAYYGGIYVAFKKTKSISFSSLIAAILNIIINLGLINLIGLYAASFSTLVSFLVLTIYRAIDLQKHIQINYNYTKIILSLSVLTVVAIINYLNDYYLNILNFIFALVIAVILNRKLFRQVLLRFLKRIK